MTLTRLAVLSGIHDVEIAADALDVERCITSRDARIAEGTLQGGRSKILIEHIDSSSGEIRSIEEGTRLITVDGKSCVDGLTRIIHSEDGMGHVHTRAPARYGPIQRIKQEKACTRFAVLRNDKACGTVEDGTSRLAYVATRSSSDGDYQRLRLTLTIVECGEASTVI